MPFPKSISLAISTIGQFWQEKTNANLSRWNLVLIIFQFAYTLFIYDTLPPEVPMYFSRPWGENQLTSPSRLFFLPLYCLLVWLLNYLFSVFYLRKSQLLSKLLLVFSLIFCLLTTVALINIIKIVT